MKRMKKLVGLVLAMIMVIAMAVPVMASGKETPGQVKPIIGPFELTINNTTAGHTYEAYQIFKGNLAEKDGKQVLSDIAWGSSVVDDGELRKAINEEPGLSVLHNKTNMDEFIKQLSTITTDSETLDLFAQTIAPYLSNASGSSNGLVDVDLDGDGVTDGKGYKISNLQAGYYLIKDKDSSLEGTNDVYTKYIIRVLKSQVVVPKGDIPTLGLQINDTLDGTYSKIEDYDINDIVYYKCIGTLPSNLKSYEKYAYTMKNTLPTGIKYLEIKSVYIEGHDGDIVYSIYEDTTADIEDRTESYDLVSGIKVEKNGQDFSINIDDLLTLYTNILPTQKVIVKYVARVTRDAQIVDVTNNDQELMQAKAILEYSNNPNGEGLGKTVESFANAFTFQIKVDKYDTDNKDLKLEDAQFVLYYERAEGNGIVKYYAEVITEEMIEEEVEINKEKVDENDLGIIYSWTKDLEKASILDTDKNGYFNVRGLDEGIYYLKETKAPVGYNLMETPVMVKITPTYTDVETGENTGVTVAYEVDSIAQNSDTVGIRNSAGSTLPVTGGIGTTIFYVAGGALALAAVVLLVTRKRMER